MLKAAFPMDIVPVVLSFIILVTVVLSFGSFLSGQVHSYGEFASSSAETLNSIDAAHLIENCFSSETGIIEWSFLRENKNKNVCEIEECQICAFDIGLKVVVLDIETGTNPLVSWSFGFENTKGTDHEIFVNIREEGNIHIGKMYVQII